MVSLLGSGNFTVERVPGVSIVVTERDLDGPDEGAGKDGEDNENSGTSRSPSPRLGRNGRKRVLHMVKGDLFHTDHIHCADIVMLETDFPQVKKRIKKVPCFTCCDI